MAAHQAPSFLGFSRQEHWSGLPFPSPMDESEKWKWSRSVLSDSSRPHGLQPTRLLCPWDFLGKSTGVACHCLLWQTRAGPLNIKLDIAVLLWSKLASHPHNLYNKAGCTHYCFMWEMVQELKEKAVCHQFRSVWIYSVMRQEFRAEGNSVQFSRSVMSDSLRPHGLQHAGLLCSSASPRTCSNSCPLNQWCQPSHPL